MKNVAPLTLLTLMLLVGVVVLQVFFSRRENKWLGLILPAVSFCISLTMLMGYALYTPYMAKTSVEVDGVVVEQIEPASGAHAEVKTNPWSIAGHAISSFAMFNIPTIILLGIHFACREKKKKANAVEKMSIQDLE